jgi:hypothetical protein
MACSERNRRNQAWGKQTAKRTISIEIEHQGNWTATIDKEGTTTKTSYGVRNNTQPPLSPYLSNASETK